MGAIGLRVLLTMMSATCALMCYEPPGRTDERPYRIDINGNLPTAEKITKLMKNTFMCKKIASSVALSAYPFGCQAGSQVEVYIGSKVSLAVDRAVLETLVDIKFRFNRTLLSSAQMRAMYNIDCSLILQPGVAYSRTP